MDPHRDARPLLIRPGFSRGLAILVVSIHVTALIVSLALPGVWPWILPPLIAASGIYHIAVDLLRRAPWSIESVLWAPDGSWILRERSGREREATLSPATFITLPVVVLRLRLGRLRRRSVVLAADAVDAEQLRRLRQRLRIEGRLDEQRRRSMEDSGSL
jgi:toxin CptA